MQCAHLSHLYGWFSFFKMISFNKKFFPFLWLFSSLYLLSMVFKSFADYFFLKEFCFFDSKMLLFLKEVFQFIIIRCGISIWAKQFKIFFTNSPLMVFMDVSFVWSYVFTKMENWRLWTVFFWFFFSNNSWFIFIF
jgi:hypothetical protein